MGLRGVEEFGVMRGFGAWGLGSRAEGPKKGLLWYVVTGRVQGLGFSN